MSSAALVLVCALELLGRAAETFPVIRIVAQRPPAASPNAEAFVSRDDRTINLIASAPAFAEAVRLAEARPICDNRGPFAVIASILIHEEWHLLHGPDESDAYAAQLTAIRSLGYESGSGPFNRVWAAMVAVSGRRD